jgi:DNA-binding transcriptional ArsR family regulator
MSKEDKLHVILTYGDLKMEFSGTAESVLQAINSFIAKEIPSLNLAKKVSVVYSAQDLIERFGELVKLTPEGPRVWKEGKNLSDKDVVCLQLIGAKLAYELGKMNKQALTIQEIVSWTGLKQKSVSSRLSELAKMGYVDKETIDSRVAYKITTQGIAWINSVLERKLGRQR